MGMEHDLQMHGPVIGSLRDLIDTMRLIFLDFYFHIFKKKQI